MKLIILILVIAIEYSFSQLLIPNTGPCACDLTTNKCDIDCCCDPDCKDQEKQSFACDNDQITPASYGCFPVELLFQNNTGYLNVTVGNQYCVYQDNYTLRNFYVAPTILSATNISNIPNYGSMPTPVTTFDAINLFNTGIYAIGANIYTVVNNASVGVLSLSRPDPAGKCSDGLPLTYLTNEFNQCTRNINLPLTDCSNMPGTSYYYVPGMVVPSTPLAMITIFNSSASSLSSTNFAPVNCSSCTQNNMPTYNTGTNSCHNVVTAVKYEIYGELNISSVVISLTYGNVNASFVQQFNVTFIKTGYSSTGSKSSGSPGYLQGCALKSAASASSLQDMTIISGGDCGSGARSPLLFGVNVYGECSVDITSTRNNCLAINSYINTSFSPYLAPYVAAYGNLSLDNLVPRTVNDDMSLSIASSASPCMVITKLTTYIVYARTGTLTLSQNKIVGYQTTYSYDKFNNNSQRYWVAVSLRFVDNSLTLFDLDDAVARAPTMNTVRDFLHLLVVSNGSPTNLSTITITITLIVTLSSLFQWHNRI